jgi:hypothetical protein
MCLAYPEYRAKMDPSWGTKKFQTVMMVANLSLMVVGSVCYVVGAFFGPVSLSVPVAQVSRGSTPRFTSAHSSMLMPRARTSHGRLVSKLLFNMLIMGTVLRMTEFTKDQKVGTYCIMLAIATLPELGPADQPLLDPLCLVQQPVAVIWLIVLTIATVVCIIGMVALAKRAAAAAKAAEEAAAPAAAPAAEGSTSSVPPKDASALPQPAKEGQAGEEEPTGDPNEMKSLLIYTTAQVVAAVLSTSVSKMFPRVPLSGSTLGAALVLYALAGFFALVNVRASLARKAPLAHTRLLSRTHTAPLSHMYAPAALRGASPSVGGACPVRTPAAHRRCALRRDAGARVATARRGGVVRQVVSLILAATAVDQALFVPATVMSTIIINMITGIIIWQARTHRTYPRRPTASGHDASSMRGRACRSVWRRQRKRRHA